MTERYDGALTDAQRIDREFDMAFEAQRLGRMGHYAAGLLIADDHQAIERLRAEPDHWDGRHGGSFQEHVADARQWYAGAERHYLQAASLHHSRDPQHGASAEQMIRQLPSPLREELTVLRDDFRRAHDGSAKPTDQLDRFADYLSSLDERIAAPWRHQRDNGNNRSR